MGWGKWCHQGGKDLGGTPIENVVGFRFEVWIMFWNCFIFLNLRSDIQTSITFFVKAANSVDIWCTKMLGREGTIQLTLWTLGHIRKKILIKTALLISYHILGSVITILILAEAQKPRRRIGIAEWKVFARLESFLRVSKVPLFRTES